MEPSSIADSALDAVLDRVFAGEATADDDATLAAWVRGAPGRAEQVAALRDAWPRVGTSPVDLAAARDAIRRRAGVMEPSAPRASTTRRRDPSSAPRSLRGLGVWAGALLLAIGAAVWARRDGTRPPEPVGASMHYATQPGQRATVTLPDETEIVLAPATSITVRGRHVTLAGEALFTVRQQSATPFIVSARGVDTRVLGTEFGVRAYAESPVSVAVRSGRVSVADRVLGARDVATVEHGAVTVTHDTRVDDRIAFGRGALVLTDVPLGDAVADLNRWFDVELRVAPALAPLRLTATFGNARRSALTELLAFTLKASVTQSGRVVTVRPR